MTSAKPSPLNPVLAADYDRDTKALREELARMTSDRDAKSKRMWELGHECDAALDRAAEICKTRELRGPVSPIW